MSPKPPILIHALGRSGSNVLLDCFDLTPATHCRNEPHTFPSFPTGIRLTKDWKDWVASEDCMPQCWDTAVRWMGSHFSHKDRHHPQAPPKSYYRPLWQQLRLPQTLLSKGKVRKTLSALFPELQEEGEYALPAWLMEPNWTEQAIHVLKVGEALELHLPWILENRPDTKVIFLVRHPLGFAQSLYKRFYQQKTINDTYHARNYRHLQLRREQARQLGVELPAIDLDALSRFEVLLWDWLVFHEIGYHLYSQQPAVRLVTYERILAAPVEQLKAIYAHCDLPWDDRVERAVAATFSSSAPLARSFAKYWSAEEQQIADDLLRQSSMRGLWTETLWQSLEALARAQAGTAVSYQPY